MTEVLRTLVFIEKPVTSRNGRWFTARIMPYRTLDNQIDGGVMIFFVITALKLLEEEMQRARDKLAARLANLADKTQEQVATQTALQAERTRCKPEAESDQVGGDAS